MKIDTSRISAGWESLGLIFHTTCAAGIVRPTELAWRMRRIRVYPKSSHTQFFDGVLGKPEVAKGKERIE